MDIYNIRIHSVAESIAVAYAYFVRCNSRPYQAVAVSLVMVMVYEALIIPQAAVNITAATNGCKFSKNE